MNWPDNLIGKMVEVVYLDHVYFKRLLEEDVKKYNVPSFCLARGMVHADEETFLRLVFVEEGFGGDGRLEEHTFDGFVLVKAAIVSIRVFEEQR